MPLRPAEIQPSNRRARQRAETREAAAELPSVYYIDVHCTEVADIVRYAGGWLFDHVMAGWHVNVNVGVEQDLTALQILGIRQPLEQRTLPPGRKVIAVASDVLDDLPEVRHEVIEALRSDGDEVLIWGERPVADWERPYGLRNVQYPVSIAARAFKAHALTAANIQVDSSHTVEVFRTRVR